MRMSSFRNLGLSQKSNSSKFTTIILAAVLITGGFFVATNQALAIGPLTVYVGATYDDTSCSDAGHALNTDCFTTIQAGVDAVASGGTVNVAAGTYAESVTVSKSVTITGAGDTTILDPATDSNGFLVTADSVTIQYLKITLSTTGVDAQAIRLEGASSVTITHNTIETIGDKGVGIWIGGTIYTNSNNLTISNNTITIAGASTGIYAEGKSTARTGWSVTGNHITANNGNPLELYDISASTVDSNTMTTTVAGGANVIWTSELANISNLIFTNNILDGSNGSQVVIGTDLKDAPLDPGNAFTGSVTTVTITGNTFSNWASRGLRIGYVAGAGTTTGVTVNNNKFLKVGEALKNYDASTINAENNYWGSVSPDFATTIVTTGGAVDHDPWYTDEAMSTLSDIKAITAFTFPTSTNTVINEGAKTIVVTVPAGTDVTALVATFTTTGASVKIGADVQTSGVTANDFTTPKTYTVTALNDSTADYTVTVKLSQTITIDTTAPDSAIYGSTFPVAAHSDSGLTVDISMTGGCSISSGTVTMTSGTTACVVHYNQAGNGTYNAASEVTETVTAQKKGLSVTGYAATSRAYNGGATAEILGTPVLVGVVEGDTVTPDYALVTGTFSDKNIGLGKTVNISGITTDADSNNYSLTQPTVTADITPVSITVTAAANTKTYDGLTTAAGTPTVTSGSLVAGDVGTFTETYDNKNVGTTHVLTPTGTIADGDSANMTGNYAITFTSIDTGIITQRAITVTAASDTKTYDGTTSAAATPIRTAGTLASGDTQTLTESYDTSDVGTGKTLTPLAVIKDAGNAIMTANYDITYESDTTGEISKANATIVVTPYSVTYDATDHTATTSIHGVQGEELVGLDVSNTTHTDVGDYPDDSWSFTDVTGNYNDDTGTVHDVITIRAITITADAVSKEFGASDPELTYQVTSGSLAGSDAFDGLLIRDGGETVGTYAISQGSVSANSNYAVTYVGANFSIVDTTPPVITRSGSSPVTLEIHHVYTDAGATAADNYDGNLTSSIVTDISAVNKDVVGSYTVTYNVVDANGNHATQVTRTVNVIDSVANAFDTISSTLAAPGSDIANNLNTVTTDNITSFSGLYFEKSIAGTPVGRLAFSSSLNLSDSATQTFLQNLGSELDSSNGRIALDTATSAVFAATGASLTMYNVTPSVDVTKLVVRSDSGAILSRTGIVSGFSQDPDTHNVTFTAAHFTQFDIDTTPPVITLSGSGTVSFGYGTTYSDAGVTAADNLNGNLTSSVVVSGLPDNTSDVGTYTVRYNASDTAGNHAEEVTRTVHVTARPITVTAMTNTKTTDGNTSATATPTITSGTLASGDTANFIETYDNSSVGTGKTLTPSGTVTDGNGGNNYTVTFVTNTTGVILAADQAAPDPDTGDATVNSDTPNLVITDPNQEVNVTISSGTTNPTIDVSEFITGGTGTLPEINITSANVDNVNIAISGSTTVTSEDPTWNGVIAAPTVTTVTLPTADGENRTLETALEVGFTGAKLSFDKAVRILLPGGAGNRAGYIRTGITFTEISTICSADTQTAGDALAADGDCKMDVGADLVIWTKHFTTFAAYSATSTNSTSGSGGGGGTTPVVQPTPVTPGKVLGLTSPHENGTLVASAGTVYLIMNGQKRGFRDAAEYLSYGFDFATVQTANSNDLALPDGAILKAMDGTLALDTADGRTVYVIGNNGTKRGFVSESIFKQLGYKFSQAVKINLADYAVGEPITTSSTVHPDGTLVISGGTIWWINNGQRHGFTSMDVFKSYGWNMSKVLPATSADMNLPENSILQPRADALTQGNWLL